MALSNDQIAKLLTLVGTAETDELDCGGCFDHMSQFAEAELLNREIPDALKAIEKHLDQCPCCQDEYNALLEGLRAIDDVE